MSGVGTLCANAHHRASLFFTVEDTEVELEYATKWGGSLCPRKAKTASKLADLTFAT